MIEPWGLFWLFLRASLFSTGGTGNLPLLHQELTARGVADERDFAEALAIGQVSPGPSGLWVVSFGFLIDGWRGGLLALLAILLPPLLVLLIDRLMRRAEAHPAMQGFVRGMMLAGAGAFIPVLVTMVQAAGWSLPTLLIVGASVLVARARRVPVIVHLALAAALGILVRMLPIG
jgi:chromate transporter